MKTTLPPEQSAALIAKGIRPDKASEKKREYTSLGTPIGYAPIFTLADLLGLLPKVIITDTIMCENDICLICISWDENCKKWFVGYELIPHPVGVGVDSELIDALFSTLCWAIDNNLVKVKQPCQS